MRFGDNRGLLHLLGVPLVCSLRQSADTLFAEENNDFKSPSGTFHWGSGAGRGGSFHKWLLVEAWLQHPNVGCQWQQMHGCIGSRPVRRVQYQVVIR